MLHSARRLFLALAVLFGFAAQGATQTLLGSIAITGTEQSSGSTWDSGTVTATINGVTVSYAYGQFSTPQAVASALGALISNSCNMPVYAQANGATLNFYQKGSNTITSASINSVSSNSSLFPTNSFLVAGGSNWSPPGITAQSFTEGPPQMGFTINGENFGTGGTITIGGEAATVVPGTWTSDSITVQVPNSLAPSSFPYILIVAPSNSTFEASDIFTVDPPFGCN